MQQTNRQLTAIIDWLHAVLGVFPHAIGAPGGFYLEQYRIPIRPERDLSFRLDDQPRLEETYRFHEIVLWDYRVPSSAWVYQIVENGWRYEFSPWPDTEKLTQERFRRQRAWFISREG